MLNSVATNVHRHRIVRWFHNRRDNQYLLLHTINTRSWIKHIFQHRHQLMAFQLHQQRIIHLVSQVWVFLVRLPLWPLQIQRKTPILTMEILTIHIMEYHQLKIILTLPAITVNQTIIILHHFDTKHKPFNRHQHMDTRLFSRYVQCMHILVKNVIYKLKQILSNEFLLIKKTIKIRVKFC